MFPEWFWFLQKKPGIAQRELMAPPKMVCPTCYSTEFRLSRLRAEDRLHLLLLRYPVRCAGCNLRMYGSRRFAGYLRKLGNTPQAARRQLSR
jgi:hypothetical protein